MVSSRTPLISFLVSHCFAPPPVMMLQTSGSYSFHTVRIKPRILARNKAAHREDSTGVEEIWSCDGHRRPSKMTWRRSQMVPKSLNVKLCNSRDHFWDTPARIIFRITSSSETNGGHLNAHQPSSLRHEPSSCNLQCSFTIGSVGGQTPKHAVDGGGCTSWWSNRDMTSNQKSGAAAMQTLLWIQDFFPPSQSPCPPKCCSHASSDPGDAATAANAVWSFCFISRLSDACDINVDSLIHHSDGESPKPTPRDPVLAQRSHEAQSQFQPCIPKAIATIAIYGEPWATTSAESFATSQVFVCKNIQCKLDDLQNQVYPSSPMGTSC